MLQQVTLANFKSFREAAVPLGGLTLVVGTNASGKTNLRDALRFLHGVGLGYPLAEILGEKFGPGGIPQWRGIRGGVREVAYAGQTAVTLGCQVRVRRTLQTPYDWLRYQLTVDLSDSRFGPRVARESLHHPYGYVWDSHAKDDPPAQKGEHQIRVRHPRGGSYRAHGKVSELSSARPVLSQLYDRDREPATVRRACGAVLDVLESVRFLDLDPDAMRQPSQPGQTILGDRGENLSSVIQGICADEKLKGTLVEWVRLLTPMDATDFELVSDFTGKVLLYLVEADGRKVSALSASDGTLRFLALVAALLSPDTGRIYFFEELDNGIHPTRLHLLLELVQKACVQQDIQVIGTTHNPALLAFLDQDALEHALLVYRTEEAPDSRIRRIVDLPDIRRILQSQDLGRLHASGWLEDAALFDEPDEEEAHG